MKKEKQAKINKMVIIATVAVFMLASLFVVVMDSGAQPPTAVHVNLNYGPGDLGESHTLTIQEGINNVSEGGTVYVHEGTYVENIIINKSVTLTTWNGEQVVITANDSSKSTVDVGALSPPGQPTNVTITGNFIINASNFAGIYINNTNFCTIQHVEIKDNYDRGIYMNGSHNNTIFDCVIRDNSYHGCEVFDSNNNTFKDNLIYNNTQGTGIWIEDADNNTISGNTLHDNYQGIFSDDWTGYGTPAPSYDNIILNNHIFNNSAYGISIDPSHRYTISGNIIHNNIRGIWVDEDSSYIDIFYNDIYENQYGIYLENQSTTEIHWNNIYNNTLYGVYHEVSSSPWVNATYNWWGHVTGPYDPPGTDGQYNEDGEGDNVTDYVLYSPWLNAPYPDGIPIEGAVVEYIPEGGTRTLEEFKTGGCEVTVTSSCDNKIIVTIYLGNPVENTTTGYGALSPPVFSVGEYFDVVIDKLSCTNWPINITIYYSQAEIANSGVYESELDGIRFWNATAGEWQLFNQTGVNPADVTVSGTDYAGYVWANAWHLTPVVASGSDASPPETSIHAGDPSYLAGDTLYVTNVTKINLTTTSKGCEVNHTYYRVFNVFNGTWYPDWKEYYGNFSLEGEGLHYVEFYSIDKCGHIESTNNQTVYVDTTPPKMSRAYRGIGEPKYNDPGEWYVTEDTWITLFPEDDGAGVNHVTYRINGGGWTTYTGPFRFSGECDHLLEVNVTDYLGNYNNTYREMFHVDLTGPTTNLSLIGPHSGQFVSKETIIRLIGKDNVGPHNTGIKEIHYKINTWEYNVTMEEDVNETSFSFMTNGTKHIEYWSIDNLGNEGPHFFGTYTVDSTPPCINKTVGEPNITENDEYWVRYDTPINVSAVDCGCAGGAGMDTLEYNVWNVDGQYWWYNDWQLLDENGDTLYLDMEECTHMLVIRATDTVGNVVYDNETFHIDMSPPYVHKEYGSPLYEGNTRDWGTLDGRPVGPQNHYINSTTPIHLDVADEPGCGAGVNWTKFSLWWWNETYWEPVIVNVTFNESTEFTLADYDHLDECLHYIEWKTVDKLNNSDTDHQFFMVDNTPPEHTKEIGQPRYPDEGEKAVDQTQMNISSGEPYKYPKPDDLQTFQLHDYQSFTPSQPYLDAINISLERYGVEDDVYVTLYSYPDVSAQIATAYKQPDLGMGERGWIQFHFNETLELVPGRTYYFDVYTDGEYNWSWSVEKYPGGTGWMNELQYETWTGEDLSFDWAFKTEYYPHATYIATCTSIWINATDPEHNCSTQSYHIHYRKWNGTWTDWAVAHNRNVSFSFWEPGTHYLEYYVTDNLGNPTEIDNETFYVYDPSIIAEFDYEPKKDLTTADTITFTAINTPSAPGTAVNYTWEFGDGTMGYGRVVTHRYEDPSSPLYDVNLTVTAFDGIHASSSQSLDVDTTAPGDNFDVDFYWEVVDDPDETNPTTADNIKFIYDGFAGVDYVEWQLGDGTISYQRNTTHSYADNGTYTVHLTAQYNSVARWIEKNITIYNTPPIADFEYEAGVPKEEISFTDTSTDSDGSVVAWGWEFGDGDTATTANPTHTYASEGVYTVNLTVTDDDGASDATLSTISK
ncbi:MAG: right-handed parallel beta-helix repeat-containing protein, partial [Thermoplasmatota archaeon]